MYTLARCASPERKAELRRQAEEAKMKEKQKRVQASRLGKILADQTTRRVRAAATAQSAGKREEAKVASNQLQI